MKILKMMIAIIKFELKAAYAVYKFFCAFLPFYICVNLIPNDAFVEAALRAFIGVYIVVKLAKLLHKRNGKEGIGAADVVKAYVEAILNKFGFERVQPVPVADEPVENEKEESRILEPEQGEPETTAEEESDAEMEHKHLIRITDAWFRVHFPIIQSLIADLNVRVIKTLMIMSDGTMCTKDGNDFGKLENFPNNAEAVKRICELLEEEGLYAVGDDRIVISW